MDIKNQSCVLWHFDATWKSDMYIKINGWMDVSMGRLRDTFER